MNRNNKAKGFKPIPWVHLGFRPFSRQNHPIKPKGPPQARYDFPRESAEKGGAAYPTPFKWPASPVIRPIHHFHR
jgi:hypothetical protein